MSIRLGLPVLLEEKSCSLATMPLAAQCLPIAFIVTTVYEILWTELRKKGCSPIMEKKHILGDVDGRRPEDVSLFGQTCGVTVPFHDPDLR